MTETVDPRAARRGALRKAVLQLVISIVVLDAVAIGIYYGAHIDHAVKRTQTLFTGSWTVVSLIVVLTLLKRVRKLRYSRL